MMTRWVVVVGLVLIVSADVAPAQPAAPARTYTVTPNTNAILLMPDLATAPAPGWLKPGTRLVYDRLDGTLSPNPRRRGGGHGFDQLDVLAVLPDAVVVDVSSHLIVYETTHFQTAVQGIVGTPGDVLDAWITPDVFHKYMDLNGEHISSVRMDYDAMGKKYHAVSQTITGPGRAIYIRDIETGLLLRGSQEVSTGDERTSAISTLLEVREVKAPWTLGKLPRALQNLQEFKYVGEQSTNIPGVPLAPSPVTVRMNVTGHGPDFVQFDRTGSTVITGVRQDIPKIQLVTGMAQLTPIAVDPDDLARLRQGQELDSDSVTKVVTRVSFVGRGEEGRNIVTIHSGGPGANDEQTDVTYDAATGFSIAFARNTPASHQSVRLRVTDIVNR